MASPSQLRLTSARDYHSYHSMQDRDSTIILRKFAPKMIWKKARKILDVGCGPGDFTTKQLLPLLPANGEIVAVDLSQGMIEYATNTFTDARLHFKIEDITDPKLREKYKQTFDIAVSFYCLHWVQNQQAAMKNIYDVLRPGGEILLVFLASAPIYLLYEILAKNEKWTSYMTGYKEAISPYYYSQDPESEVRDLLKNVGFDIKDCKCASTTFTSPSMEVLYKAVKAVNPFLKRIPQHLLEEYHKDCLELITSDCSFGEICEVTGSVEIEYSLITVYANKPDHILKNANR